MTFEENAKNIERIPVTVLEYDWDRCQHTHGVSPCAAISTTKCYNTLHTCQDSTNYFKAIRTLRFCTEHYLSPFSEHTIPSIASVETAPAKLSDAGISSRSVANITLKDHPTSDYMLDDYVDSRSYNPIENGTFWGKLIARQKYFYLRPARLKYGYISNGVFSEQDTEVRHYLLDKIVGPNSRGDINITLKDPLVMLDDDKAQFPKLSDAQLSNAINSTQTSIAVTKGNDFVHDRIARIGSEIITYTGINSLVLQNVQRGQFNTLPASHDAGSELQYCKKFENINIVVVLNFILGIFTDIKPDWIPFGRGSLNWTIEQNNWLSSYSLNTLYTKSIGVKQVVEEITKSFGIHLFWDDISQEIKIKAIAPSLTPSSIKTVTDEILLGDKTQVSIEEKKRISRVWLSYDKIDYTKNDEIQNYRRHYIDADIESEGENYYNSEKTKRITSPLFTSPGLALQIASRLISANSDAPILFKGALRKFDALDMHLSDNIKIQTSKIQNLEGLPKLDEYIVTKIKNHYKSDSVSFEAINTVFLNLTFGKIQSNTNKTYSQSSQAYKKNYAFIAPNSGTFSDGAEAYKIV